MRRLSSFALVFAAVLVLSATAHGQLFGGGSPPGEDDKGVLASLISRALSTPATRVSIGAVEGALSSDATVRDIAISDRDGVWLRLDRARIVWRRLALLQRRLEIDRLEIGTLDIARRPVPAENKVAGEDDPLLPQLPVKVEIKAFALADLRLGEPILGAPAQVSASGAARLGDPSEGLDLSLDARRLDGPGTLTARLGLVPEGQRLTLALKLDEPAGGIVARAASIPGLPPVRLDLDGQGTLDAFAARLGFDAGPEIGAAGNATLRRDGAARRLALDLQARIAGLLPGVAAPVFAGDTRLTGNVAFGDDRTVTLSGVELNAAAARFAVAGAISPAQVADITVTAANLPNAGGATVTGAASIRRLDLRARVTGPIAGPNVDATLALADASTPGGRLGALDASLALREAGRTPGGAVRLAVTADARATGLAPTDPDLARALGGSATIALRGTTTTELVAELDSLTVTTPTLAARYAGRLGSDELRGQLGFEAARLEPFGGLAGLALSGQARLSAAIEGTPRANRYNLTLDGGIDGFATGIAPVDGVFGGRLGLAGTARVTPTGGYIFEALRLTGAGGQASLNGALEQDAANLTIEAAIPNLARADGRLSGRATLSGRVTGGIRRPDASATLTVADALALGRPVPRLVLSGSARDLRGAVNGQLTLDGVVDSKPARGAVRFARAPDGGLTLDGLDTTIGSVALRGSLALDPANLATGRLTLNAGNLADLSALMLSEASGALDADLTLAAPSGRQNVRAQARGERIGLYGLTVSRLAADLTATDLYGRIMVMGEATADEIGLGGERITRVRLTATGSPDASDLALTAAAAGFDLDAKARVIPGERTRVQLTALNASRGGQRIGLAGPATLTVAPRGVQVAALTLAIGAGRLTADGLVGTRLDVELGATRLPLSAADLLRPGLGLGGTLSGSAKLTGAFGSPEGAIQLQATGLTAPATRDARLPPASASVAGRIAAGRITLDGSTLSVGSAGTLKVAGSAPLGTSGPLDLTVSGALAPALANGLVGDAFRFSGLLDLDLGVRGTLAEPRATVDAKASRFATGSSALDGLLGPRPTLAGTLFVPPGGGYGVDGLQLSGAGLSARADGVVAPGRADLNATVAVPDLRRADRRLTGRAEATARISGDPARPGATVRVAATDATALGRPVPRLALDAAVADVFDPLDARVTLDGEVDRRPAKGRLRVARPAGGGTSLEGLDVTIGSATARGDVFFGPEGLGRGRLVVDAPNLDDLSPLLLTKATGSVDLDIALSDAGGRQDARLKASADRVAVYGLALSQGAADLAVTDLYRRPAIAGTATIAEGSYGGERVSRVRLNAAAAPGGSDVTFSASARGFDLDGRALVVPGDRTRIEVSRLAAARGNLRLALANPATLTLVEGGAEVRGAALVLGSGRLTLDGLVGSRLNLRAEARAVPLSAADLVSPGLGLSGTLGGSAEIGGSPGAPTGEYRARIDNLGSPATRGLGLPRIDATASGRFEGVRATLDAAVTAGRAGSLRITGSVPVSAEAPLDLAVKGTVNAGTATGSLLSAGRQLTGRVDVDARVGGTLASPEASGAATLSGGTYVDATLGVRFTNIRARVVARGTAATIENASATARNGGVLTASGRVELDPGRGFPGEIRVVGRNAELVRSGLVTAIANLDVSVAGPLARDPRVAGRVDLIGADIPVPEQLPGTLRPLPGTRHLNPTRTTRARLALDERTQGRGGRAAPPFDARLDLVLNAPGRIFVRGRGLNAELGGILRLTGTLAKPNPVGAFTLQRGTFQALTSRLTFTRGRLTFGGDLTPELDFEATTNAGGAAIQVAVSGPANAPVFSFTSSPDLPQDEVLSRLLFNAPSGQLSAFQALALAQAAAQFSAGEGSDSFEALRRSLGLTGFDITLGSGSGPGAAAQRALGDRVSVGVRAGGTAGQTGLGADVRITDDIRVQGEVGVTGGATIGIGAQFEW